jgi:type IV secretory pathway VirJ component
VLALLLGVQASRAAELDGGMYGPVQVTKPTGPMRGFVILLDDRATSSAAEQLAGQGALVVAVDTKQYAARLSEAGPACHRLDQDADSLSRQIQREMGEPAYATPILAGTGMGGLLAEDAVEQAPPNTVAGAVVLAPAGFVPGTLCPADRSAGGQRQGFLVTESGPADTGRLVALVSPHLRAAATPGDRLADLPLVELPATGKSDRLAIVISGDGGWRDLDKTIAERLREQGVSVIGWDSLRYFWHGKTPELTATDLGRVLQTYEARWQPRSIALIGYSFGADVLPFAYNRLAADLRARVALVALLGFDKAADFEIRVGGWLGLPPSAAALPVAGEIERVPPGIVLCFYGEDETDSACPALERSGAEVVRTIGSHHFGGDYDRLARDIIAAWPARTASPQPNSVQAAGSRAS